MRSARFPASFGAVSRAQLRSGLVAGAVGAAATAGALLGIGLRLRTPARPFNAIASHLVGPSAIGMWSFHPIVTVVGLALHLILCCACGVVFVYVIDHVDQPRWMVAAEVAFGALIVSLANARLVGTGLAALLSMGDLIVCDVVLAVALALGIRLASPTIDQR